MFVSENLGGVDPARQDRQSVEGNVPDQLPPAIARKVVSYTAINSGPSEFRGDFMRARLGRAGELAEYYIAISVALYFGFRMSIHRDEAESAKNAVGPEL